MKACLVQMQSEYFWINKAARIYWDIFHGFVLMMNISTSRQNTTNIYGDMYQGGIAVTHGVLADYLILDKSNEQ